VRHFLQCLKQLKRSRLASFHRTLNTSGYLFQSSPLEHVERIFRYYVLIESSVLIDTTLATTIMCNYNIIWLRFFFTRTFYKIKKAEQMLYLYCLSYLIYLFFIVPFLSKL